jgi:hypothetical protein
MLSNNSKSAPIIGTTGLDKQENPRFEIEPAYQQFIDAFPPITSSDNEVRKWIRNWFGISGVFASDVALPVFLREISLPGQILHRVQSKKTIFVYLDQCSRCQDGKDGLYNAEILDLLADYMWVAIENWRVKEEVIGKNAVVQEMPTERLLHSEHIKNEISLKVNDT